LISAIVNNPEKAFNHFTSQTSFTSSRSAYINLMNDEENLSLKAVDQFPKILYIWYDVDQDVYVDHIVDYVGFEWIANQDGIVQIGDDIYDFSKRDNLAYLPADLYDFSDPYFHAVNHPLATSFDLRRTSVSLTNPNGNKIDVVTCRDDQSNGRVLGQLEASEIFLATGEDNYHVRTRFFRKVGFAWFGTQAELLESDWDLWIDVVARVPNDVPMFNGPPVATRFQGSHIANQGDRQNTRYLLVGPIEDSSRYISGQRTNAFPGAHRSNNRAEHDGRDPSCTCNLR
jgi:hypothetical protein